MKILILSLLFGCALAAPQIFGARNDFDLQSSLGSYLPPNPSTPDYQCQPQTVYETSVQYRTTTVYSTVYKQDNQYVTQTVYDTQVIPTTFYSEVVQTQVVPSVVYTTRFNTRTAYQTRTVYVTAPANTRYVTQTQTRDRVSVRVQTQYETQIRKVPTTVYRDSVSTTVVARPVISTVYRTQVVTRQQQIPGQTRYVTSVQYSTVYSTNVIPATTVYLTQTVSSRRVQYSTVYARPETRVITSTQVVPVYTTIYSQKVDYRTETRVNTQTRYDERYSTVYRTEVVPQYNTRTVSQPRDVVRTVVSTQVVPTTFYSNVVRSQVVNAPANTQYLTVTETRYSTVVLPGQTRTNYNTRTAYNTNYVTSTRYNTRYNTLTVTSTQQAQCKTGYNYQAPAKPFNF